MEFSKIAKYYLSKGISVVPLNDKKQPVYEWYKFQKKRMEPSEADKMFKNALGIGMICGDISCEEEGYFLTAIDIDVKNFDSLIKYEDIEAMVPADLLSKLLIVQTKSGGYHWIFRSTIGGGNQKLAMRPPTEEELKENPKQRSVVLLETRGVGGFVVCYPTPGYEVVSENRRINNLTMDEAYTLLDLCRSFNRVIDEAALYESLMEEKKHKFLQSPFDQANERMDVLGLLTSNGFTIVGNHSDSMVKLKRPGKSNSTHSGYYDREKNRYVNFSTSTDFDCGKSYNAAALFTILECNGSWEQSYKQLLDMGYGVKVDISKKIKSFISAYNKKDLKKLLELSFGATNAKDGVIIEGVFYPCN